MRKLMFVANWKMNKTVNESVNLVKEIMRGCKEEGKDIIICPPFTALCEVSKELKDSFLLLGAQNMHFEAEGAYTGEVSPIMLKGLNVKYVIIGHSERRQYFNETNESVNKKLRSGLKHDLRLIFCVGETLEQREAGETEEAIKKQVQVGLQNIPKEQMPKISIAYEPVWAIGTGRNASPEQAEEVHAFIRGLLKGLYDQSTAEKVRILYGGSVNPDNIQSIIEEEDIDGALVGGASLKAQSFIAITKSKKPANT